MEESDEDDNLIQTMRSTERRYGNKPSADFDCWLFHAVFNIRTVMEESDEDDNHLYNTNTLKMQLKTTTMTRTTTIEVFDSNRFQPF